MVLQRLKLFPAQLMVAEPRLFGDLQKFCWDLRFGPPGQPADMVIQRDRAVIAGALPDRSPADAELSWFVPVGLSDVSGETSGASDVVSVVGVSEG